jgi:L-asparaginase II
VAVSTGLHLVECVPHDAFMHDVPLVALERGGRVESLHRGIIVVVRPDGSEILAGGDVDQGIYLRSSAKPFQAMALLLTGAMDGLGLTERELAVVCASHSGQPEHIATVTSLLEKAGIGPETLQCGAHPPLDKSAADDLLRAGIEPTALHNNCSGKHAGMLATAAYMGWPLATYRDPAHPLQQLILRIISTFVGIAENNIGLAVDGCGAPVFYVPVRALAVAFARLATGLAVPDKYAEAAWRVRQAMMMHPFLIAGTGRFDTELMEAGEGRVVCKGGAQGAEGIGLLPEGIGVGIKITDGSTASIPHVSSRLLTAIGALQPRLYAWLARYEDLPVYNHAGTIVGRIVPVFNIEAGTL